MYQYMDPLPRTVLNDVFEKCCYLFQSRWLVNRSVWKLVQAIEQGDVSTTKSELEKVVDINRPYNRLGMTWLMWACFHGRLSIVKLLVSSGANVNGRNSPSGEGNIPLFANVTAMHISAACNFSDVIEYLAEEGAKLDVRCHPLGFTPLHRAVFQNRLEAVKTLLKLGANVNVRRNSEGSVPLLIDAVLLPKIDVMLLIVEHPNVDFSLTDDEGLTALHFAILVGRQVAVSLLLEKGVNVNAQTKSGHTPLDLALQRHNEHLVDLLQNSGGRRNVQTHLWRSLKSLNLFSRIDDLKETVAKNRADVNMRISADGSTPLITGVLLGQVGVVKYFLRKGADINLPNFCGLTPLICAIDLGRENIIKLLLERGADINASKHDGWTTLHSAASTGSYSLCKLLISQSAQLIENKPIVGPPLYYAIKKGHVNIIKLFLNNGHNVNSEVILDYGDSTISTAIHWACLFVPNKPEVFRALIDGGADVNKEMVCNAEAASPLKLISKCNDAVESMKLLIESGAVIHHDLMPEQDDPAFFQCVFYSSCAVAAKVVCNTKKLFEAVRKNDIETVRQLRSAGGLVNATIPKFDTPLIYASWKGFTDIVRYLLAEGARPNMLSPRRSSALHFSARFGHLDVLIELLKFGADPTLQTAQGKTALELATAYGHRRVANVLVYVNKVEDRRKSCSISTGEAAFHDCLLQEFPGDLNLALDACLIYGF